jgi:SAM-dependent methyltransferase
MGGISVSAPGANVHGNAYIVPYSDLMINLNPKGKTGKWDVPRLPGESDASLKERRHVAYFEEQLEEDKEWWDRMGVPVDFCDSRVLDLGCGHGALSFQIAEAGAKEIVGLDLDSERLAFAQRTLEQRYAQFKDRVTFIDQDILTRAETGYYDYIISKDSFEHIENLEEVTDKIASLLKDGGKLIVGFSPLYYSPFGDHQRFLIPFPWLPVLVPEWLLLIWISLRLRQRIRSVSELALNKMTPKAFRNLFHNPKWKVVTVKYNRGKKRLMPLMARLRRWGLLEKYFTVNIYAILKHSQHV